jgi:methylated-DNA-[protein]-cysteine S-methyltransferase
MGGRACDEGHGGGKRAGHLGGYMENVLYMESPIGVLKITSSEGKLTGIDFGGGVAGSAGNAGNADADLVAGQGRGAKAPAGLDGTGAADPGDPVLSETARQLGEYFAGKRRGFDLPICLGGTDFQRKVWDALARIPYGETVSYGEIAAQVGSPGASRAVGMANNRNPISIVIPCHRVIGHDGALVGYGGGLDKKRYLLELEKSHRG